VKTWEDLSDLDKGAALVHLRHCAIEGDDDYAARYYPCRYFDDPELIALTPLEASRHAQSLTSAGGTAIFEDVIDDDEYERLYALAYERHLSMQAHRLA
jgi:hypothetical protein